VGVRRGQLSLERLFASASVRPQVARATTRRSTTLGAGT
jgi:hypothetical protein